MGTKTIRVGLSTAGINRALKELKAYKQEVIRKTNLLRERISELLAEYARSGYAGAVVDDLVKGGQRFAQVEVTMDTKGNVTIIMANGEDAVWAEFGSGVYANGGAGGSPHPMGSELGFLIGGYGKGYGKREVWGFYEDGELRLTHGAPASMPMYNAVRAVCDRIPEIAREVWG